MIKKDMILYKVKNMLTFSELQAVFDRKHKILLKKVSLNIWLNKVKI